MKFCNIKIICNYNNVYHSIYNLKVVPSFRRNEYLPIDEGGILQEANKI